MVSRVQNRRNSAIGKLASRPDGKLYVINHKCLFLFLSFKSIKMSDCRAYSHCVKGNLLFPVVLNFDLYDLYVLQRPVILSSFFYFKIFTLLFTKVGGGENWTEPPSPSPCPVSVAHNQNTTWKVSKVFQLPS